MRIEKQLAATFLGNLKSIDGNLVVKSNVSSRSGSVALRQLSPIHKMGLQNFF